MDIWKATICRDKSGLEHFENPSNISITAVRADSLSAYWFDLYSITNSFNNRNHVIVYKTVRFSLN